jgi:hypothetical protein
LKYKTARPGSIHRRKKLKQSGMKIENKLKIGRY